MNDMTGEILASAHCCEEASTLSHSKYIPCNRPARKMVLADGKELRMCEQCAWHSEKNRGMKVVRDYGASEGERVLPETGHNKPPDPIDEALAPYGDAISEAENWLDGAPVENEAQMNAVDAIIKELRTAKSELAKAEKSATAPLHDAWKSEIARWKPTKDDIERRLKGLAAVVDPFKRKLAAEKEEAKRKAYEEARAKERAAEEARTKANAANYEEAMEADRLAHEAMEAKKAASAANRDTVKGLRTVTRYQIDDYRALLHWIAVNRRDDITAFIEEWARRNHKPDPKAEGLKVWQEKEAY